MQYSARSLRCAIRNHSKAAVAVFFLFVLLTGFFTTAPYGHAWDDGSELRILRMALKEYANLLPIETSHKAFLNAMDIPRISESIERDHGVCAYYPLFWAVCSEGYSQSELFFIWRIYTWMLFTAGLFALYACGRHLGLCRPVCCLGVLIMLLSPRFFADGHYNNKDIALLVFTLMLLWQTARLMEKPSVSSAAGFALAAGFCAGTRVIGIAVCGLCGLMIIVQLAASKRLNRRSIAIGGLTVCLSVLCYLVLTPAFLSDPIGFAEYTLKNAVGFSRWHGYVLYWGDVIACASTKPPRTYLPVLIAVTTPLWALLLLAAGCFFLIRKGIRERLSLLQSTPSAMLVTVLLCWVLPLLGGIAVRLLVYNGWRHVYFLYGPMVLCMIYGFSRLQDALKERTLPRRAGALALTACMLYTGAGIALNHPYQYGYYNCLVPKEDRAALFEMDYWNLSCRSAVNELLAVTDGPISITASDRYSHSGLSMAGYYVDDERFFIVQETDTVTQPNYLLANLSYAAIFQFEPSENMIPVVTISSYGCPMTVIYRIESPDTP